MKKQEKGKGQFSFWAAVWCLGLAGQLCWNMENQWFNTFVYEKIAKDPTIISFMVAISALATALSTFLFGCLSDRMGKRKPFVYIGYILWGIFTILFGATEFITGGQGTATGTVLVVAGTAAIISDAIMSFFGSMGSDVGFNAWVNDHMTDQNKGQLGAAMATQPVIGTIVGTIFGGMLVGSDNNYMRLFVVMGGIVIVLGIVSMIRMKDSPKLQPSCHGTFGHQFFSIFNFRQYFAMKELFWVNMTLGVYFIAFNVYFTHMGNYMIYYLGFTPDLMGLTQGLALILAMFSTIPAAKLINSNRSPLCTGISVLLNFAGVLVLGLFVRPENVNPNTVFNPVLLLGTLLVGIGYVLFLQTITVWGKQLYPEEARGQFEGIRILFFVLIPMLVAPLISNPIIKSSGRFEDAYGFTEYLPTHTLFLAASVLVLLTFVPLYFSGKYHNRRIRDMQL